MIEFTGMDWEFFFHTIFSLIYAMLPVIIILSGIGFVLRSINQGPGGVYSSSKIGIILGITFLLFGIIWGIMR